MPDIFDEVKTKDVFDEVKPKDVFDKVIPKGQSGLDWWKGRAKRAGEIFGEEAAGGVNLIKQSIREIHEQPAGLPLKQYGKILLGAGQTAFSPFSGVTQSFLGEGGRESLKQVGVPDDWAESISRGLEAAPYFVPVATISKMLTKGGPEGFKAFQQLEKQLGKDGVKQLMKRVDDNPSIATDAKILEKEIVGVEAEGVTLHGGLPFPARQEVQKLISDIEVGKAIKGIHAKFDVEAPFKNIGAADTGFNIKNYSSQREMWETEGLDVIKKLKRSTPDAKNRAKIVEYAENPKLIPPKELAEGSKVLRNYFDKSLKELKDVGVLKRPFKESKILELQDRNTHIRKLLIKTKKKNRPALTEELKGNLKSIQALRETEFVHVPVRMWFENEFSKDPAYAGRVLGLLNRQGRKTITVKDLMKVVPEEKLDSIDMVASYARRKGRDIATMKIVNAAEKDGLIVPAKQAPENWINLPDYRYPLLKDKKVNRVFADYMVDHIEGIRETGKLEHVLGSVKMMQFYNPLFLPMYDSFQHGMIVATRPSQILKAPVNMAKAIKSMVKHDADFWEAINNGIASTPYTPPFDNYKMMVNSIRASGGERVVNALGLKLKGQALQKIYQLSWNTAWQLDKMIRMMSYHALKDVGLNSKESAQWAAKFHSDYASVPPKLRRKLNKFFFTPTFKITMAKITSNMIAETPKIAAGMKKWDKGSDLLTRGLISIVGINVARDKIVTGLGWERDQWARRYYKTITDENGEEKELVWVFSDPTNMWLKYVYRAMNAYDSDNFIESFGKSNRWEIHPLHTAAYDVAKNKKPDGTPIYEGFDKTESAVKKGAYLTKRLVKILGLLDPEDLRFQEGFKYFKKDMGKVGAYIFKPFTTAYTRTPREEVIAKRAVYLENKWDKMLNAWEKRIGEIQKEPDRKRLIEKFKREDMPRELKAFNKKMEELKDMYKEARMGGDKND